MAKKTSPWKKKPQKKAKQSERVTRKLRIKNSLGLHARAAASFVKTAFRFKSDISLSKDSQWANGKSIMGLLTLAAAQGTWVTLEAVGPDAQRAVDALSTLIDNKFGEE